jgi:hypothetical protein
MLDPKGIDYMTGIHTDGCFIKRHFSNSDVYLAILMGAGREAILFCMKTI